MFVQRRRFSRSTTYRFLSIALATLLGVQPLTAASVTLTKDQQRQYVRFVEQLLQQTTGEQSKLMFAASAVGQLSCMKDKKAILGATEWQELQIDSLIRTLDKTETSFGRTVFRQTMQPTTDMQLINMRTNQVQTLLTDPELFAAVEKELQRIKKAEDAILAYWDDSQYENQGALFYRAKDFYESSLSLVLGEGPNLHRWSLEASAAWKFSLIVLGLGMYLGINGLSNAYQQWAFNSDEGRTLDVFGALFNGLKAPWISINPWQTYLGKKYDGSPRAAYNALWNGSMGDAFHVLYTGMNDVSHVDLKGLGRGIKNVASSIPRVIPHFEQGCCLGLGDKINNIAPCKRLASLFAVNGKVEMKSRVIPNADTSGMSCWGASNEYTSRGIRAAFALGGAAAFAYGKGTFVLHGLRITWRQAKQHVTTLKELHVHTIHMARALDAMQKLAGMITDHEVLRTSCTAEHMHDVVAHPSEDLKKLFELLKDSTFTLAKAQSHVYSRGNVLLAHRMFGKVKDELVPLLQAVGELDAAYAMARNIKERAQTDTPFVVVEFVPEAQATINLERAWLPMVKQPIANTMQFGGGAHPNKIIITGPNGGGKSVFLKTIGCSVLLAQSWGVAPAKRAQMSFFDGVRSCIHPQESIEHELSTFMAEKMRIDEIRQYLFQHNNSGFKALLLLDEPFKGTVDAESADRIYTFGKEIAPLTGLIVSIATHVEKPIHLAQDTGAYENYHVCIKELPDGRFERQFTIEPGVLRWWFDDPEKRSRFIDFVTMEKYKEHLKRSESAAA